MAWIILPRLPHQLAISSLMFTRAFIHNMLLLEDRGPEPSVRLAMYPTMGSGGVDMAVTFASVDSERKVW